MQVLYKNYLKTKLAEYITSPLYIANDITYKPLEKDASGVVVIINSGVGSSVMVDGGDYMSLNFAINFLFDANETQNIISDIQSFMLYENAKYLTLSPYDYRATFSNPYILGDLFELAVKNENGKYTSLKCINVVLNVTLTYSSTINFKPSRWYLTLGTTEYEMLGIDSYEFASAPVYESTQFIGESTPKQRKIANIRTFHFKLIAIKSNALHTLLLGEFTASSTLADSTIKLKKDSTTAIDIQTINVSETWSKGVKIIDITLGR